MGRSGPRRHGVVPVRRDLQPHGEACKAAERPVPAPDRDVGRRPSYAAEAGQLRPGPGVEGEVIVATEQPEEVLRGVRTKARKLADAFGEVVRRERGVTPA